MLDKDMRKLIRKLENRDETACKAFIRQYQRLIFHIVCRYVSRPQDQEDLAQDVFIKIFDNIASFHGHCKLSTWIGKIAYHASINYIRKVKVGLYDDMKQVYSLDESVESDGEWPDEILMRQESSKIIDLELEKLPPHYRMVITLYHLEQMHYSEIGEIMGLAEGTVKSHLFRARQFLKKLLIKQMDFEEVSS